MRKVWSVLRIAGEKMNFSWRITDCGCADIIVGTVGVLVEQESWENGRIVVTS
jgi:hypothetical protein